MSGPPETCGYSPRELIAVENAARTGALAALERSRSGEGPDRAIVFAGRTAAGAAAMAAARHLANYGFECRVVLCGPEHRLLPLAALARGTVVAMRVPLDEHLDPSEAGEVARSAGPGELVVDGAGDAPAPGREEAFARCVREGARASSAGEVITLAADPDRRTAPPAGGDAVFTPDALPRSREEVRLLDSAAIREYAVPGLALMENAGWGAAREAWGMLEGPDAGRVLVLAGPGNNGGDGFVLARHLRWWGVDVSVLLAAERERVMDDARAALELAEAEGVPVTVAALPEVVGEVLPRELDAAPALVVDALLGTGLSGAVRGPSARAVEILEKRRPRLLAIDTPSGLDANTGEVLGAATHAERTVTFACGKLGFALAEGPERTGEVVVVDISAPRALWDPGRMV